MPARERLYALRLARLAVYLRRVVEDELGLVHGPAELADQREAPGVMAMLVPASVVELVAGAVLLGHVHRDVRRPHDRLHRRAVLREDGDSDRALALQGQAADHDRLLEHLQHAADDRDDGLPVRHVGQEDRELVAAQPGHGLGVAQHAVEPRADALEEMIVNVLAAATVPPSLVTRIIAETDAIWRGTGIS